MKKENSKDSKKAQTIKSIPFGERPGRKPYNASEVVALDDSRFLFCDNNISDALFELRLTPEGAMAGPLIGRPLRGVEPGTVDDLEGMVMVKNGSQRFIFAAPSLSLKLRKKRHKRKSKRGKAASDRASLLRISVGKRGQLDAEVMPDFRSWLIGASPILGKSPKHVPDDGGLNIEGLEWNPAEQTLLFGMRTPVAEEGRPIILRVRLKEIGGPWNPDNFEMLPPVVLKLEEEHEGHGIRALGYFPSRGEWLVVIGNSTSSSNASFNLYSWDGNADGLVRRFNDLRFHKKMRVEGVVHGMIAGREAIVFVDDKGGYYSLWADDPRLQQPR